MNPSQYRIIDSANQKLKLVAVCCLSLLLSACFSDTSYAPTVNAWQQPQGQKGRYTVHKGDTIYSIAWSFGLDYRALAAANGLKPPYPIHPGQRLRMQTVLIRNNINLPQQSSPAYRRQKSIIKIYSAQQAMPAPKHQPLRLSQWVRPAHGRIISAYSSKLAGNQGIDIAGWMGEPIRAAATGSVVYSGDGVRGYGNLLIIKHNDSYLSAYAFNKVNLVRVGQQVKAGDTIAKMGRDDAGCVKLHFEIRRDGKPVNPERYIHG